MSNKKLMEEDKLKSVTEPDKFFAIRNKGVISDYMNSRPMPGVEPLFVSY